MKIWILLLLPCLLLGTARAQYIGSESLSDSIPNFTSAVKNSIGQGQFRSVVHYEPVSHLETPSSGFICGSCGPVDSTSKPLYVLVTRRKEISGIDHLLSKVNAYNIEKLVILHSGEAENRFGEAGKNGAVVVSLKKEYLRKFLKANFL